MVQSEEIGPFEFQKLSHFQNKVKWKKPIWWEWVVWMRIKKLIFHISSGISLANGVVKVSVMHMSAWLVCPTNMMTCSYHSIPSKSQCNVCVTGLSNKHDDLPIPQYALSKKSNYLQLLDAPLSLKSHQKDKLTFPSIVDWVVPSTIFLRDIKGACAECVFCACQARIICHPARGALLLLVQVRGGQVLLTIG